MENTKKKMNKGLVAGIVILSIMFFIVIWGLVISRFTRGLGNANLSRLTGNDTIDIIYVQGTIGDPGTFFSEPAYRHAWTIDQINQLMNSQTNRAIMLYINSPGGGVYESDELYLKLQEYKEETGRPVYAYMAQTAASGGYYISLAADKIYANRMTMTGSIGVIMSTTDIGGLEEKLGIKTENIVSGRNKAMGSPLTEEQREILQEMVDETYEIFVGLISENRKIDLDRTKQLADGRIYTATQAKALNLIDEIGNFEAAVEDLRSSYGLEHADLYDVVEQRNLIEDFFGISMKNFNLFGEFGLIKEYIENNKGSKLMYYAY